MPIWLIDWLIDTNLAKIYWKLIQILKKKVAEIGLKGKISRKLFMIDYLSDSSEMKGEF